MHYKFIGFWFDVFTNFVVHYNGVNNKDRWINLKDYVSQAERSVFLPTKKFWDNEPYDPANRHQQRRITHKVIDILNLLVSVGLFEHKRDLDHFPKPEIIQYRPSRLGIRIKRIRCKKVKDIALYLLAIRISAASWMNKYKTLLTITSTIIGTINVIRYLNFGFNDINQFYYILINISVILSLFIYIILREFTLNSSLSE